jgi:hypothetical protein
VTARSLLVLGDRLSCEDFMRKRLLTAALVSVMAGLGGTTVAHAALPRPTVDQLATIDPASSCVRGEARPFLGGTTPRMRAFVAAGENPPSVSVQFRMVDLGTGQRVFTGTSPTMVAGIWFEPDRPIPELTSGRSYSWQARVFDGTTYSDWSRRCEFTVDVDRPSPPGLTVSPEGPYRVGQEITLQFSEGGSTDVVRYGYGFFSSQTTVLPVGVTTVKLILPFAGPIPLSAWGHDRAGNVSDATTVDLRISQ